MDWYSEEDEVAGIYLALDVLFPWTHCLVLNLIELVVMRYMLGRQNGCRREYRVFGKGCLAPPGEDHS